MVDLYLNYNQPLTHNTLFEWHKMITNGRRDLDDIGRYRTHDAPMQVVSGRIDKPTVHFEAPLSESMTKEMDRFITWFNTIHEENHELNRFPLNQLPRPKGNVIKLRDFHIVSF